MSKAEQALLSIAADVSEYAEDIYAVLKELAALRDRVVKLEANRSDSSWEAERLRHYIELAERNSGTWT